MRIARIVLLVLALVAAGCGSDSDDAASPTAPPNESTTGDSGTSAPTTSEPAAELTASFRGVTADTITVGLPMLDFDQLVSLNLSTQGWGDQQLVWQSFIDELNNRGGINGRMLVPEYRFYFPVGTTEAEAVCLELTEDIETFAVLGSFLGPAAPANPCIPGQGKTILVGNELTLEGVANASAPWLADGTEPIRRLGIFVDLLDAAGMLEGRKIAVIGSLTTEDEYAVAPQLLRDKGVEPVLEAFNDVVDGEILAGDTLWTVLAERVRVSGADTVLVLGATTANIRGIVQNGLDVDIWASRAGELGSLGDSVNREDADGTITIGALTGDEAWESAETVKCREIFTAANPDIEVLSPAESGTGDEQWYNPISAFCRTLRLFETVATEAGPDLTQESFAAAAERVGEFVLPGAPYASLGPGKPDANDAFRLIEYESAAAATDPDFDGEFVSIGELTDSTP